MISAALCLPPFFTSDLWLTCSWFPRSHTCVHIRLLQMLCCLFRLDEALSQYFGEGAEVAQQEAIYPAVPEPIRKCPQCNKDMVLKTKKSGGSVPSLCPAPSFACSVPAILLSARPRHSFLCHSLKAACCCQPLDRVLGMEQYPTGTWS